MTDRRGEGGRGFLKRWSRLKLEEAERRPAPQAPPVEEAPVEAVPETIEAEAPAEVESTEASEAEPFDPADLPDIDSLGKDSDYTGFLKEGVPAKLRHLALQKLFRSDPALAVLDGLNDYDEDFTLATVAEKILANYKPGRDYVDHEDEGGDVEDGDIETGDAEDGDAEDSELADADETEKTGQS
jgi:hypothetical protein